VNAIRAKLINFLKTKGGISKEKFEKNEELIKNLAETIL
jgi:hypothetical protein